MADNFTFQNSMPRKPADVKHKVQVRQFFWTISVIGLTGCSYEYMSIHGQKGFRKDRHSALIVNQTRQIREKNEFFNQDTTRTIYIQTITRKQKGNIGIYGYNSYSTHFGRVNFFQYKDNIVTLLDRSNLDNLQTTINKFLLDNSFSKKDIQVSKDRVKKLCDINSTDVF
jgi:hypothetical protein